MKKQKVIAILGAVCVLCVSVCAHAGLKQLMKLGKSQANMQKVLKKETTNYNKVKKAIVSGKLEEGMEAAKIRKKYGEPIFDNIYDRKRNAYKWLYMPASSSHFEGEKIYLFVDEGGSLVGWKLLGEAEGLTDE